MSTLRQQFGRRLRQLRRHRDLTQEQLAAASEISVEFLSNMERGINAPSFETLQQLAAVLGVPVMELFAFSEQMPPENESSARPTGTVEHQWVSLADAARQSGYSVRTLQKLVKEGKIVGWKPGHDWFTSVEEVMTYKETVRQGRPRRGS